jgi:serine/threonine protein kinase
MNCLPDFRVYGYQIEAELGANRAGGRVTYLAVNLETQQLVVIKQFQFAQTQSTWGEYDSYEREIQILQDLEHAGIPRYMSSFQTEMGFCMVQEYKKALPLSTTHHFNLAEIRKIAVSVLEILTYLQTRKPYVIHRDIKPENILIDDQLGVYLIDFGFAHQGRDEVGVSSVVKGTLGFMPPEQLFNRHLTEASDLYSLGMTLICLLTRTKSSEIGNLVNITYQVKFKHLVPKLHPQWINWLEKMVDPRLEGRYPSAMAALAAIPTVDLCPPEIKFSVTTIDLTATRLGETLIQNITLTNAIPDTLLQGSWEVEPHSCDPAPPHPHWISVQPQQFASNEVDCQIAIDTSRLRAGKTYSRKLVLKANTAVKTYIVPVHIQTAPVPIKIRRLPYGMLTLLWMFTWIIVSILGWSAIIIGTTAAAPITTTVAMVAGVAIGFEVAAWFMTASAYSTGAIATALSGIIVGMTVLMMGLTTTWLEPNIGILTLVPALIGLIGGWIIGLAIGLLVETLIERDIGKFLAIAIVLSTIGVGTSLGIGLIIKSLKPLIELLGVSNGLLLSALLIHLPLHQRRQLAEYRRLERYLIKS